MTIIFLLLISFMGVKVAKKGEYFENSFSQNQTKALKGVFAVAVMLHHLYSYVYSDFLTLGAFKYVGYLMVGGFFLISGYGLMYGATKKENYLKGFFRKRVLGILIPYYIINFGYVFLNYNSANMAYTKEYIIRSVFGLHLWYVPVMVMLYTVFFFSMKIFKKNGHIAVSIFVLLYVFVTFALHKYAFLPSYGRWWYNSAIAFALGMWYCIYKDVLNGFFKKYYKIIAPVSVLFFAVVFKLACNGYVYDTWKTLVLEVLTVVLFSAVIIILSMKAQLGNKLINLCGDLSFELYLIHAIFIAVFRWYRYIVIDFGPIHINYFANIQNGDLFLTAVLVSSFIAAVVIHKLCKLIIKPIVKSVSKK